VKTAAKVILIDYYPLGTGIIDQKARHDMAGIFFFVRIHIFFSGIKSGTRFFLEKFNNDFQKCSGNNSFQGWI
jgi:hypothetical protein